MKVAIDTSVLIAGVVSAHPQHARALPWLAPNVPFERSMCAHAMAEVWATLTAMPLSPRITGAQAGKIVHRLCERIEVLPVADSLYKKAIDRCSERGARSGAIYDALHALAAECAGADVMLTFNVSNFERLISGPVVRTPPDPPATAWPG